MARLILPKKKKKKVICNTPKIKAFHRICWNLSATLEINSDYYLFLFFFHRLTFHLFVPSGRGHRRKLQVGVHQRRQHRGAGAERQPVHRGRTAGRRQGRRRRGEEEEEGRRRQRQGQGQGQSQEERAEGPG